MQTLKFLGRGSAFNVKEGNTSAYFKDNDTLILIDCGESIFERIQKHNILEGINNVHVLITHNHSDHIGSLSSLIYYCYYVKHIKINVYSGDNKELDDILKMQGNTKEQYSFKNCIYYKREYITDNFFINFIPVKHIKEIECSALVMYVGDKTIYYSGDCSDIHIVVKDGIIPFDEIYHDTCLTDYEGNVHTSLRKLDTIIPLKDRNKTYCMHLDCSEVINKAKKLGFNVVETIK